MNDFKKLYQAAQESEEAFAKKYLEFQEKERIKGLKLAYSELLGHIYDIDVRITLDTLKKYFIELNR